MLRSLVVLVTIVAVKIPAVDAQGKLFPLFLFLVLCEIYYNTNYILSLKECSDYFYKLQCRLTNKQQQITDQSTVTIAAQTHLRFNINLINYMLGEYWFK